MRYWVFTVGLRDQEPPVDWLGEWRHHVSEMWFPATKRPVSVDRGDRALIYGSRGRGFIAAVEVTGDRPEPNDDSRFPHKLGYRLLVSKAADINSALPQDADINPSRVIRGPHTEISSDEYRRGVALMLDAAARTALEEGLDSMRS
jgi:hypothetical protein